MSYVLLAYVATGDLATAALQNQLIDNLAILKTSIANDGRLSGELLAFREEVTTVAVAAGVVALNLALSNNFKTSITANITSITLSGWTASKVTPVVLRLTQDGTGGWTVALPAGWKWASAAVPTVTLTANKTTIIVLYSDDGGTTIFASLYTANA